MPELPDLSIVSDAFHAALSGRPIQAVETPQPLTMRATDSELAALSGQTLRRLRRRGKFLVLELDRDTILANPMLTGRLQLAEPEAKRPPNTTVVVRFGPRSRGPADRAAWTRGATWLPADDASVEVRYRDPTRMGKVYVLPAGVERPVPGWGDGELGPDADDPDLTLETWRARIRRHPGELKNLLRNQVFVAGLGNAYSDEVLHEARLLPFRKRASLAGEEVDELYGATRRVLANAVGVLRERVPPTFERQVRDFLAVHAKGGQPCPRCGTLLTEVSPGGFVTTYCRGCQR